MPAPPARMLIPATLRPRWRDLPRLAWVLARTYTAGPAWLADPAALVSACLLAGPCLVALHAAGQLAGIVTPQSAAVAVPDSRSRPAALAGLVGLLLAYGLTSGVALAAGMAALTLLPTAPAVAYLVALIVLAAAAAPALSAIPRALHRETRPLATAPSDGIVNMVGAWPQRRGAGGQLMAALTTAADTQHVTLRLTARNAPAGALYQRCGFTFDQPQPSRRMTRRAGTTDPAQPAKCLAFRTREIAPDGTPQVK